MDLSVLFSKRLYSKGRWLKKLESCSSFSTSFVEVLVILLQMRDFLVSLLQDFVGLDEWFVSNECG